MHVSPVAATSSVLTEGQKVSHQQNRMSMTSQSFCVLLTYKITNVVSTANVIMYLNQLRNSRVGPSDQITKVLAVTSSFSMVFTKLPDDVGKEEDRALVVKAKAVETKIK